jgi:hypothetical protein
MTEPAPPPLMRLKIAIVEALMRNAPGLRGINQERAVMRAQLVALRAEVAELAELRSERDALLRGMAMLLEEKAQGRS